MEPKELTPIPIPTRQKWREFRMVYLPVMTFSLLVVLIGWMWVRYLAPATMIGEVETTRASVITTVTGTVQEIKVGELATVTNGQELAVIRVGESSRHGDQSLLSPIDGFVSVINHVTGEKVTAGEKILVVSAEKSHRILAWVRQPVAERPNPGDVVKVHGVRPGEPEFEATVATVGKQLEQINPEAFPWGAPAQRGELGLPLIVNVDAKVDLIPGEAVQLRIFKRAPVN